MARVRSLRRKKKKHLEYVWKGWPLVGKGHIFFFLIVRERKEGRLAIDADGFVAIVIGNEGALIL